MGVVSDAPCRSDGADAPATNQGTATKAARNEAARASKNGRRTTPNYTWGLGIGDWERGAGNWARLFGRATLEGCDSASRKEIAGLKPYATETRGIPRAAL